MTETAEPIDLVIPNIAEFNLRHPLLRFDPSTERSFVVRGAALSDQSVYWQSGRRVLLLASGADPQWLADVHEVLRTEQPPIVCPAPRTGQLVTDLLLDDRAITALRGAVAGASLVRLCCWGATPQVYPLAATVRSWGVPVELDVTPEGDYWASVYLESKQSCVDLAALVPELRVPPSFTASTWSELCGAVRYLTNRYGRVIVKSGHGVGGDGSAVVGAGEGELSAFLKVAQDEPFFRTFPLIVQRFVEHAPGIGCPAVDMLITDAGPTELVPSVLAVTGHRLQSVSVGFGLLAAALERRLLSLGERVGQVAAEIGFRGWFGIDCVVGTDSVLYATEINARRTGGMHPIGLLRRRDTLDKEVVYSVDDLRLPQAAGVRYPDHVRPVLARQWAEGIDVCPTTVRSLDRPVPSVGLMVAAANMTEAQRIVEQVATELRTAV